MGTPSDPDPCAVHDPKNTARFAGLVWLVFGAAILGLLPIAAEVGAAALAIGAAAGASAVVLGLAMVRARVTG